MAVIQPKDSLNKKKFQFQVPAPILNEYKEKRSYWRVIIRGWILATI